MRGAEHDNDGMADDKRRALCGYLERIAAMALWIRLAEKLYMAVRKKYFLRNMTRRTWAVFDCFVASFSLDERSSEILL